VTERETGMASSYVTVGSGDHHVLAVHGWFGVMKQTWLVFFPGAELAVLSNAGHYPMFETPVALATSIEEFLGPE
jgi:pimeloyl-ACP methyl ester carboxylesterase